MRSASKHSKHSSTTAPSNEIRQSRRSQNSTRLTMDNMVPVLLDADDAVSTENSCVRRLQGMVLTEDSPIRKMYEFVLTLMLVYTGTLFPYRLCFVEFHLPEEAPENELWTKMEYSVDVLFWIDLLANFFLSERDNRGVEITNVRYITSSYLRGLFWVNLIACTPADLVTEILGGDESDAGMNRAARMTRFQRISRLARLTPLLRLVKLIPMLAKSLRLLRWSKQLQIMNYITCMLLSMHLLSCLWYLSAVFPRQGDIDSTWVWRRREPENDPSLLEEPPVMHWGHALYFVISVVTSAGFGDIAALTIGEVVLSCFMMLAGTFVISFVRSEIVNTIHTFDRLNANTVRRQILAKAMAEHAQLDEETTTQILRNMKLQSNHVYDRKAMNKLLSPGVLPATMLSWVAYRAHCGLLASNRFLVMPGALDQPVALTLQITMMSELRYFCEAEYVYRGGDYAFNVLLVLEGTFAAVARPSPEGGVPERGFSFDPQGAGEETPEGVRKSRNSGRSLRSVDSVSSPRFSGHSLLTTPRARSDGGQVTPRARSTSEERQEDAANDFQTDSGSPQGNRKQLIFRSTAHSAISFLLSGNPFAGGGSPTCHNLCSPYKLLSFNSYFGDVELLEGGPRRCCMRCEAGGDLLVVTRKDFFKLLEHFPQHWSMWRKNAMRREDVRFGLLRRLHKGLPFQHLAASLIQETVRRLLLDPAVVRKGHRRPLLSWELFSTRATPTDDCVHASAKVAEAGSDERDCWSELQDLVSALSAGQEILAQRFEQVKGEILEIENVVCRLNSASTKVSL